MSTIHLVAYAFTFFCVGVGAVGMTAAIDNVRHWFKRR